MQRKREAVDEAAESCDCAGTTRGSVSAARANSARVPANRAIDVRAILPACELKSMANRGVESPAAYGRVRRNSTPFHRRHDRTRADRRRERDAARQRLVAPASYRPSNVGPAVTTAS